MMGIPTLSRSTQTLLENGLSQAVFSQKVINFFNGKP